MRFPRWLTLLFAPAPRPRAKEERSPIVEIHICPRVPVNIWHARAISTGHTLTRRWMFGLNIAPNIHVFKAGSVAYIVALAPWAVSSARSERQNRHHGMVYVVRAGHPWPYIIAGDSVSLNLLVTVSPADAMPS